MKIWHLNLFAAGFVTMGLLVATSRHDVITVLIQALLIMLNLYFYFNGISH